MAINFMRHSKFQTITIDGVIEDDLDNFDCEHFPSSIFLNLATFYEPKPSSMQKMTQLVESNILFPIKTLEEISSTRELKIINTQSYMQLLPAALQNPYSLTKEIFAHYVEQNLFRHTNLYVFDTFGDGDTRGKVVDSFARKIFNGEPIYIPENTITLNLLHAPDVCNAIMDAMKLKEGNYSIMSQNNISLEDLAILIMRLMDKKTTIIKSGEGQDLIKSIEIFPENIISQSCSDLEDALSQRLANLSI